MQFFDVITICAILAMVFLFLISRTIRRVFPSLELVSYVYIFVFASFIEVFKYFILQWDGDVFLLIERCFFLSICGMVFSIISGILREGGRSVYHDFGGISLTKQEINKIITGLKGSILSKVGHVQKTLHLNAEELKKYKMEVSNNREDIQLLRDRLLKTLQIVNSMHSVLEDRDDKKKY